MFTTFLWLNVTLSCFKQLPLNSTLVLVPSQSANIGPQEISRTSSSHIPRRSPKDPTWLSRGRPDLTSRGRPNLTFWVCPNLTFKGRPWEVDFGRPQDVLRTSPRGSSECSNLDVPAFSVTLLSELIRLTKSI